MTTFAHFARRLTAAALLSAGVAAATAPTASADVTVSVKLSTKWAVVGFPVTATVTSSASGTLYLAQVRNDGLRQTKAGYCGHPEPAIYRQLSNRPITANAPLKITIQPASLAYFGGDVFDLGTGCWNAATAFDRLDAYVRTPEPVSSGSTMVPLQRVL